jgi:hypothetical protein
MLKSLEKSFTKMAQENRVKFDIGHSVSHMFKRQLSRMSNGHYKKSWVEELWTLAAILLFLSFAGLVIWGSYGWVYYLQNWTKITFMTFLFPFIAYVFLKLSLVMRWCLYWILVATAILFVLNTTNSLADTYFGAWVFAGFLTMELMTILVYLWTRLLFPGLIYKLAAYNPYTFWDIRSLSKEGSFTCRTFFRYRKRKKFSYVGQVNAEKRPHGFGKWTSEWKHGEVLTGYWEDGIPIGPFKSREYSSCFGFSNVRVAFCSTDSGKFNETTTRRSEVFKFGCVGVECSSSG